MQINTMMTISYNVTYKWSLIYKTVYEVGINISEFILISMVLIYFHNYTIMKLISNFNIYNFWEWVKMLSLTKFNIFFINSQLIYWYNLPLNGNRKK
jgi:hypothetical protein